MDGGKIILGRAQAKRYGEGGRAARTIAAHLRRSTIAVEKLHVKVEMLGGLNEYQAISAHTPPAVTDPHDLSPFDRNVFASVVDQNKVVTRAVHLGEFQ
jgi:hypothetical protein